MWADVLTKPLQGKKFRDMRAFLQNCPRDYDDDIKLNTDQLARKLMNQQVKTVASSRECVDGHAKQPSQPRGHPRARAKQNFRKSPKTAELEGRVGGDNKYTETKGTKNHARSPTCVSRVTWGPSQVVLIPDRSEGSHKGAHKGSHKESTKDGRQRQRVGKRGGNAASAAAA
jgi:hypothetical protein